MYLGKPFQGDNQTPESIFFWKNVFSWNILLENIFTLKQMGPYFLLLELI